MTEGLFLILVEHQLSQAVIGITLFRNIEIWIICRLLTVLVWSEAKYKQMYFFEKTFTVALPWFNKKIGRSKIYSENISFCKWVAYSPVGPVINHSWPCFSYSLSCHSGNYSVSSHFPCSSSVWTGNLVFRFYLIFFPTRYLPHFLYYYHRGPVSFVCLFTRLLLFISCDN